MEKKKDAALSQKNQQEQAVLEQEAVLEENPELVDIDLEGESDV